MDFVLCRSSDFIHGWPRDRIGARAKTLLILHVFLPQRFLPLHSLGDFSCVSGYCVVKFWCLLHFLGSFYEEAGWDFRA